MPHEIHVVDRDVKVEAEDGENILKALLNGGVEWMHACGGFCNCTTCRVEIIEGQENISDMEQDEKNTLIRFQGPDILEEGDYRLSCQVKVYGDIKISEPEWY